MWGAIKSLFCLGDNSYLTEVDKQWMERLKAEEKFAAGERPTDTLEIKVEQDGVTDSAKLLVLLLEGDGDQINQNRIRHQGINQPCWLIDYLIPHFSNDIHNFSFRPGFKGMFFEVLDPKFIYCNRGLKVHQRPLTNKEREYLTRRITIACGTRTSMRYGVKRDYYEFPAPELLNEFPRIKDCQLLGTTALQFVNPPELEKDGTHGWYLTYMCAGHAEEYLKFLKSRNALEINPAVGFLENGVRGYKTREDFREGRRILQIDKGLFPTRIHAQHRFNNIALGIEVDYIVTGDAAILADARQTFY